MAVRVAGGSEAFGDGVVVNDQVTGLGVLLDVGVFAGGWWSHDEGDVGGAVHPSVVGAPVDASVVAINLALTYWFMSTGEIRSIDDMIKAADIIFSEEEMAMLGGIVGFWFVS